MGEYLMPEFQYRVFNQEGAVSRGLMEAVNEAQLEEKLVGFGYTLIEAQEKPRSVAFQFGVPKVSRKDILNMTIYLHTTLSSGLTLLSALNGFVEQQPEGHFKDVLKGVATNILDGDLFAESLRRYDRVFPPLYISLIEAGEASGHLDESLKNLITYLEGQEKIAADVKQATVYPVVILSLVALLLIFILSFVLPRFMPIFESTGMALPPAARFLMGLSAFFQNGWPYLIGGGVLSCAGFHLLKRVERVRFLTDRIKLKLPLFGTLIMKVSMSQFCYNLSTLLNSGIEVHQAFALSERVIQNRFIAKTVRHVRAQVEEGASITKAMRQSTLFPALVIQMLDVGETSGSLPYTLKKVTEYYDREVAASIKRTFSILEPAIILFLGLVVGGIAVIIFSTLYKVILAVGQS